MNLASFLLVVVLVFAVVLGGVSAKPGGGISDDCGILLKQGFRVFRCAKSMYPDRDECVPMGHRQRIRRRDVYFDPLNRVCDSMLDCADGSDEMLDECAPKHQYYCDNEIEKLVEDDYLEAFRCNVEGSSSSMCVSECQMCDGVQNCPNGADEKKDNCAKMRPKPYGCSYF